MRKIRTSEEWIIEHNVIVFQSEKLNNLKERITNDEFKSRLKKSIYVNERY